MGLRAQAELDLATILEDADGGFGFPIKLTDPSGAEDDFIGNSTDIAQLIDPDTGQAVSGRLASVALRISSINAAVNITGLPEAITDQTKKPWIAEFNDINGNPYVFKVVQSNPDRTLGIITLILERYVKAA